MGCTLSLPRRLSAPVSHTSGGSYVMDALQDRHTMLNEEICGLNFHVAGGGWRSYLAGDSGYLFVVLAVSAATKTSFEPSHRHFSKDRLCWNGLTVVIACAG